MNGEDITPKCSSVQKLCYGLGHIYNDLCAAMWFSYMLFYLQIVLRMETKTAGTLIMIGQVVDSLATPVAGWAVDRTGARRAWHLAGTLAVSIGFSLIFSQKPNTFNIWALVYYGMVITLFQVGWAIVQISHLSIIPEISKNHAHSSDLTAIRYTASVCCNIAVYITTLVILRNGNQQSNTIGPDDFYKFKEIALIITFVGIMSSLIFYCGTWSRNQTNTYESIPESILNLSDLSTNGTTRNFLKTPIIYLVSLLLFGSWKCLSLTRRGFVSDQWYMASRLFTTLNLIYIPLYLDERQSNMVTGSDGIRQTIATVPLVSFTSSFLTSIILKYRMSCCSDKVAYMIGSIVSLVGCTWIGIGISPDSNGEIYAIATLIGVGGSATMVASLCLTANFVKTNGFGGGSVYSTVTFTDKMISGGVVLLVQHLQCTPKNLCPNYYEHVLGFVSGTVSIIGLISLATLHCHTKNNHANVP